MDAERMYDVVVFGATGFTGGLVAEYLARRAGGGARWAIAGRSPQRLSEVKDLVTALDPACAGVGVIEADSSDPASLARMAGQTRVVLTTVGPYVHGGEALVQACIAAGTDYVDITGEPDFVDAMIERHGAAAQDRGVRIVHCCGFDSVPHDLGALYTVSQLPEGEPIELDGFVRAKGTFSGGTWQTAIQMMSRRREMQRSTREPRSDAGERHVRASRPRLHHEPRVGGWAFPLLTIDPKIVCMSARMIDRYGPDFRYAHHGVSRSLARIVVGAAGFGAVFALAQLRPTRERLLRVRSPGQGPSAAQRATSWFEVIFLGKTPSREIMTRVSGGDPGYGETAKMVAEAALCLALDRDRLPPRTGVLTPAAAMGELLIDRLQSAGIQFEVLDTP